MSHSPTSRSRFWLRGLACALLLLSACADDDPTGAPADAIQHPVDAYRPYGEVVPTQFSLNEESRSGPDWADLLEVDSTVFTTIGGDSVTPFGELSLLVPFQDGFVVADNEEARVHLFESGGATMGTVGRAGEGPGEFRRITSLAQLDDTTLAVADVMRRVELFRVADSITYLRRVTTEFSIASMCVMDGRIYAYVPPSGDTLPPIRVMDADWVVLDRIGQAYSSPNMMINSAMGEVKLICVPSLGRLVVVPRAGLGEFYILEADGTPVHKYAWTDYRSLAILEDSQGYSATIQPGGLNRLRGGSPLGDSMVLLQYDYVSEDDFRQGGGATSVQSIVVDLTNVAVVARSSTWPALMQTSKGAVVVQDSDWPGILVHNTPGGTR